MRARIDSTAIVGLPIGRRTEVLAGLACAERVVGRALLGIPQHFIGLADFLEPRLGVLLFADVGMKLTREPAIGALDVVGRRFAADAHDLVVVLVFHGRLGPTRGRDSAKVAAHGRRFNARSLAALRGICYTSRHAGRPCSGDRSRRHRIRRRRLRVPACIAQQAAPAVGVRLDRHLPHVAAARRSPLLLVRHQPRSRRAPASS